ncbi:hypothetical protein EON67_01070 [archaeon]|nr:MAG: hypothetical protein EON67_01070 [archaeon]
MQGYTDKLNQTLEQLKETQPELAAMPIDKLLQVRAWCTRRGALRAWSSGCAALSVVSIARTWHWLALLLQNLDKITDAKIRSAIRNSGGGYVNHCHFWCVTLRWLGCEFPPPTRVHV